MSKNEYKGYTGEQMEEVQDIQARQEEICRMVRRIWSEPLLDKLCDMVKRIYRRGAR